MHLVLHISADQVSRCTLLGGNPTAALGGIPFCSLWPWGMSLAGGDHRDLLPFGSWVSHDGQLEVWVGGPGLEE